MTDINQAVKNLARARQTRDKYERELTEVNEAIQERYGAMLERARDLLYAAEADVANAETDVKKLAVAAYEATGNKKSHPAVPVAIYTILDYNMLEALEYCQERLPGAVKWSKPVLDKSAFEKAARILMPKFVTVTEEPCARIARDLSEFIEE